MVHSMSAEQTTAGDSVTNRPLRPTSSTGEKKSNLLAKIRNIAAAPQVYKEMLSTKDDVVALTGFAVVCSASLDPQVHIEHISTQFGQVLPGHATTVFLRFHSAFVGQSGEPLLPTETHPFYRAAKTNDGLLFEHGDLFASFAIDHVVYGVAHIKDVPPTIDSQSRRILQAVSGIAALSLRMARQLEIARFQSTKSAEMLDMANEISQNSFEKEEQLVNTIMEKARSLLEAESSAFFMMDEDGTLPPQTNAIARKVAQGRNCLNLHDEQMMGQLKDVDAATGVPTRSVLCVPVLFEQTVLGVAQVTNKKPACAVGHQIAQNFSKDDEVLMETFARFVAISVRNCRATATLIREKRKGDAILRVVSHLSTSDIRDVSNVVGTVMKCAKELLHADRSSLFLIDEERNELYSKVADKTGGREIRFDIGRGIAGTVARTGRAEIISDAYGDPRFNQQVDKDLGYRTRSLLVEPIAFQGNILAVAQLVNKVDPGDPQNVLAFNKDDQEAFRTFAMFAGISLSNSRLLEFTIKAGEEAMALNRQTFEAPKRTTSTILITAVTRNKVTEAQAASNADSPDFDLFALREATGEGARDAAARLAFDLIKSTALPGKYNCPDETLLNFVIRCRDKYRQVPYHNFFHAADVCQTMHTLLYHGGASAMLTELDCFVLMITTLVHDLDHMGVNNSFHLKTDSPLGILSSASGNSSVLEVHHCNLAIEILQDPASNIFAGLTSSDLSDAYRSMIDCVLATDMARHKTLVDDWNVVKPNYDRSNPDHRKCLREMLLKAADISNVTKPFQVSRLWAVCVTEEFFKQGDREKEKGLDVLPMFDRSSGLELAKGQLGFINFVCTGFFTALVSEGVPSLGWLLDNIGRNTAQWQAIAH